MFVVDVPGCVLQGQGVADITHDTASAIDPRTLETPEVVEFVRGRSHLDQLLYEEMNYRLDEFRRCMGDVFEEAYEALNRGLELMATTCSAASREPCFHNDRGMEVEWVTAERCSHAYCTW